MGIKLWIIGKKGMLGAAFYRIAKEKRIDCIATTKEEIDLLDGQELKRQFETASFSHVINCAGYTAVDLAETEQEKAYNLNVVAVENLAKLCAEKKKKLIHFSTDYIFNGEAKKPYNEEAFIEPLSIYGQTKAEGEKRLFKAYRQGCVMRTSWLFGREGKDFVKVMVEMMQKKEALRVVSDQKGRPTFCDDLVKATLELLDESGVFHFANRDETSWYEWAQTIKTYLEKKKVPIKCAQIFPIPSIEYKQKASRPYYSVLDTKKYEKKMQTSPRSWKEGLKEVLC